MGIQQMTEDQLQAYHRRCNTKRWLPHLSDTDRQIYDGLPNAKKKYKFLRAAENKYQKSLTRSTRRLAEVHEARELNDHISHTNVLTACALFLGLGVLCMIRRCFRKRNEDDN